MGIAAFFCFGAAQAFGCLCPYVEAPIEEMVKGAVETSSAVFTGKVIGYEYRPGLLYQREGVNDLILADGQERETKLVRLEVTRWWKMAQPTEILMITDQWRLSKQPTNALPSGDVIFGCSMGFAKGESYLIYATGAADRLQYRMCSRTVPVGRAADDLKVLGKGRKPRK